MELAWPLALVLRPAATFCSSLPLALALVPVAVLPLLVPLALAAVPHATELGPAIAPWPVPVVSLQTNCAAAWDGANRGAAASTATKTNPCSFPPQSALVPSKARLHRTCA